MKKLFTLMLLCMLSAVGFNAMAANSVYAHWGKPGNDGAWTTENNVDFTKDETADVETWYWNFSVTNDDMNGWGGIRFLLVCDNNWYGPASNASDVIEATNTYTLSTNKKDGWVKATAGAQYSMIYKPNSLELTYQTGAYTPKTGENTTKFVADKTYYIDTEACTWMLDNGVNIVVAYDGDTYVTAEQISTSKIFSFAIPVAAEEVTIKRKTSSGNFYNPLTISAPEGDEDMFVVNNNLSGGTWTEFKDPVIEEPSTESIVVYLEKTEGVDVTSVYVYNAKGGNSSTPYGDWDSAKTNGAINGGVITATDGKEYWKHIFPQGITSFNLIFLGKVGTDVRQTKGDSELTITATTWLSAWDGTNNATMSGKKITDEIAEDIETPEDPETDIVRVEGGYLYYPVGEGQTASVAMGKYYVPVDYTTTDAPQNLYLVGKFDGANWDPTYTGAKFTKYGKIFVLKIKLNNDSEFRVATELGDWKKENANCYGRDDNNENIGFENWSSFKHEKQSNWKITKEGTYLIIADFENYKLLVTETAAPEWVDMEKVTAETHRMSASNANLYRVNAKECVGYKVAFKTNSVSAFAVNGSVNSTDAPYIYNVDKKEIEKLTVHKAATVKGNDDEHPYVHQGEVTIQHSVAQVHYDGSSEDSHIVTFERGGNDKYLVEYAVDGGQGVLFHYSQEMIHYVKPVEVRVTAPGNWAGINCEVTTIDGNTETFAMKLLCPVAYDENGKIKTNPVFTTTLSAEAPANNAGPWKILESAIKPYMVYSHLEFSEAGAQNARSRAGNVIEGRDLKGTSQYYYINTNGQYVWDDKEDPSGTQTGVESVSAETEEVVEYYNLQGVRLECPAKGVNIVRRGNTVSKMVF